MDELINQLDITVATLPFTPWWQQTWFFVVIVLALLIALSLGFYILKQQTNDIEKSYQEVALETLKTFNSQIKQQKVVPAVQTNELSACIKQYLSKKHDISFVTMTDSELKNWLENQKNIDQEESIVNEAMNAIVGLIGESRFDGHEYQVRDIDIKVHNLIKSLSILYEKQSLENIKK